jgi:hypothetical protein
MNTTKDKLLDAVSGKRMVCVTWGSVETYGYIYSEEDKYYFFGKWFELEDLKSIYFEDGCWHIVL